MNNKKGSTGMVATIMVSLIIAGIFLFLIINYMQRQSTTIGQLSSNYITAIKTDYDGDGINDYFDKSPCVSGQEIVRATNQKEYYYYADANPDDKKNPCDIKYFPDLKKEHPDLKLKQVTVFSTNKKVCVLEDSDCAHILKEYYKKIKKQNEGRGEA